MLYGVGMAGKYICSRPGCGRGAVPGRLWCEEHTREAPKRKAKGGGKWHHLYNNRRWRAASRSFLGDNPVCAWEGCERPAEVTDHITPHAGDQELFWDYDNWQGLCKSHHGLKTRIESGR